MNFPRWNFRLCAVVIAMAFASRASAQPAALVPLNDFFDAQSVRQAVLSPDGSKIAMVAPNQGRYGIAILDTTTGKISVPVVFRDENIRSIFWKGNDRLLFYSAIHGHEIPLLASVDLQGKSLKRILEPRRRRDDFSIFFGRIVDEYPASDDHILIISFTSESDAQRVGQVVAAMSEAAVYKVNVESARRAQMFVLDRDTTPGLVDKDGNQRLAETIIGADVEIKIRARNTEQLRLLKKDNVADRRWRIRELLADGRSAVVIDYAAHDRGILRILNLDTGELGAPLFEPPAGEIVDVIYSPRRDRIIGVVWETDKIRYHWLDARWREIMTSVESQYPGKLVTLLSISDDEKRFTLRVHSDRDPGQFILADLRGEGIRAQPITAVRPSIKPELMSPMEPIEFKARDGLTIRGYLTKPGGRGDKTTPLLVLPHGGPFGVRDSWGYNREVQFLASRGYAVLQVNYRGSGGYGREFERAGYRQWGGKMQDDLTDAVKWVTAQGWADPQRVGIIGGSYGGYAALVGVTMTPDLYRIGINYVGVSDLRLITRYDLGHSAASKEIFGVRVGRDPAELAARSPVLHVANIRVPTLHAYGRNDPRVQFEHWEVLEKELKRHGKKYEILIEDAEGHGFEKEETSSKFYSAVESFLAREMPSEQLKSLPAKPRKK